MVNAFNRNGARINVNNPNDIIRFSTELHITPEALKIAIEKVGFVKSDVTIWLRDNGYLYN